RLRPAARQAWAEEWRRAPTPDRRLRAHILLLLDDGHSWALIAAALFTSSSAINRWRGRHLGGGLDAVLARPARRRARRGAGPPRPAAARLVAGAGGAAGHHPHAGRLRLRPRPLGLRGG